MHRALVVLATLFVACAKPTEILVVLSTDIEDGAYDALSVNVGNHDSGKTSFSRSYLVPDESGLPASLDLHPSSGNPTVELEVALAHAGEALVTRTAVVSFVTGRSLLLRLQLQAACEHVSCGDDQTCIDGVCTSDVVPPETLTPIPSDPLASGTDAATTSDAAASADAAVPVDAAGVTDLAQAPDSSTECPPIPAPKGVNGMSCSVFFAGETAFNTAFDVTGDPDIPTTFTCDNTRLSIALPAGTTTPATQYGRKYNVQSLTGNFAIAAGFYVPQPAAPHAMAGIFAADGNSASFEYYAQTTSPNNPDALWRGYGSGAGLPPTFVGNSTSAGAHALYMTRSLTSQMSTYSTNEDSGAAIPPNTDDSISVAQRPGFFVGNTAETGPMNNATTVQLAWIEICTGP